MHRILTGALAGAAAGATGTTALHAVTYLDMAVRGRPASRTPEDTIERVAGRFIPGADEQRRNRIAGLAPLGGIAVGVAVGALVGGAYGLGARLPAPLAVLAVSGVAMLAANAPMTRLGITDPRTWTRADWLADVVPHLAYGAVTAAVLRGLLHPPAALTG